MVDALIFLHALSPLHAGTGQGIEGIDLPIARERSTGLPILPGSSIKGCLKDYQRQAGNPHLEAVFGPDKTNSSDFAGAVSIGDGQTLLFPVRSLAHTFLWVTCPFVLQRFRNDCVSSKLSPLPPEFTQDLEDDHIAAADATSAVTLNNRRCVVLEELDLTVVTDAAQSQALEIGRWFSKRLFPSAENPPAGDTAEQRAFQRRFAILNDANFFFLARTATEVQAHVAIDHNKGTVIGGALWYQESLPAETVLVSILQAGDDRSAKSGKLKVDEVLSNTLPGGNGWEPIIQFGGKSGTGLGWTRVVRVS